MDYKEMYDEIIKRIGKKTVLDSLVTREKEAKAKQTP
jgi:hypothetical protein